MAWNPEFKSKTVLDCLTWGDLLVCYTAVFSVVTQPSWGGELRDDTKNGSVED